MQFRCLACESEENEEIFDISEDELEWEEVEIDERQMGAEVTHQAVWSGECSNGHSVEVTFTTWEYPVGVVNNSTVETDENCEQVDPKETIICPNISEEPDMDDEES